jgi:hypothetical protein
MSHEQHPDDYAAQLTTECTECRIPMLKSEQVNPADESETFCVFCWPTIQERDEKEDCDETVSLLPSNPPWFRY